MFKIAIILTLMTANGPATQEIFTFGEFENAQQCHEFKRPFTEHVTNFVEMYAMSIGGFAIRPHEPEPAPLDEGGFDLEVVCR